MAESELNGLTGLTSERFETAAILKRLAAATRQLAELKGVARSIPNQAILINTLGLREAKDSSAIENIATTHDEIFRDDAFPAQATGTAAKEVLRYRQALNAGFDAIQASGLLTVNDIVKIQETLEGNRAGLRKIPGTVLTDGAGQVVYTPPQHPDTVMSLMTDLERFLNDDEAFDVDPLIKMAILHHQFESIHPFYDGNGRTGRIVNVLYLVQKGLLDIPVLYLSRYIVLTKGEYYRLLQKVREQDAWEDWVIYMLEGVEVTARDAISTIHRISSALLETKHQIRSRYKFYSQDLINNMFMHPYTKIQFLERDLGVTRLTATRYLDKLAEDGFLRKEKVGRANYYMNVALLEILTEDSLLVDVK